MRLPLHLLLFLMFSAAHAQDMWDVLGKSIARSMGKTGAERKQSMDSVDYQFAITVHESAGFFDIEQKGELGARVLYAMREEADKDLIEKLRDSLEMAIGFYNMRMYKAAEESLLKTKVSVERNQLTDQLIYLRTLTSLGLVYLSLGKLGEASDLIRGALELSTQKLGRQSAAYVANINNLAKLNQTLGKYNDAEKQFNEALELTDKVFGESMQKAILLNNKAMLFQSMGRYDEAVELMKQAMQTAEKAPKKFLEGKKSFDNRKFQANLAYIYQVSGNYAEAETNFLAIKKIFESRGQVRSSEYAGLLNQLGILYIQMGKTDQVEGLFKKALDIYKKRFSENNIYFAKVTHDLGSFYRLNKRYTDAERELNKALNIRESLLGANHPDYINTKENLALVYWKTARYDLAYMTYRDVMDKTIEFINSYFPPMSEAEKTNYWDITAPRFQRFFNFALEANLHKEHIAQDFMDYHMATKALLLNSTSKVRETILNSNDPQLIHDYTEWINLKEQLARMYAMSKEQLREQNIDLRALEQKANAMEKSLSERSSAFSSGYSAQKVSYRQIRDLLTDTEVLVDMVRVRGFADDFTADVRYVAILLDRTMEHPRLLVLDNGSQLETRYLRYYNTVMQKILPDEYSYSQFWSRIDEHLAGKKLIYFSPDGVYNQINLNTLRTSEGQYLIHKYDIIVLGNSRDLKDIKQRKPVVARKNAVLLGYPSYETDEVPPLPGTRKELETVIKVLKPAGYQVVQFTESEASEKNLKSVQQPFILHIATHGYFLKDVDESAGSVFGVNVENATRNPLLRSGLILAGAGKAISGTATTDWSSGDNGILTAYEAMNMNLEGTALVVLSACETGLGDVKAGEGVYGLQRAFLVAGADALIMSLWKVDDEATQMLMTNFYTNFVKQGNKQRAFKQAQLQLMAKYKDPYYWGAFVMMGM